jgi:phosphatidylglycerol---prolipoprotein diacylglyceryl transferase
MYPPVDPVLIEIGPLAIRWYGLLMMLGVISATLIAARYVARQGENPDNVWDMLLWVLLPGLLGARLWYVFIQSPRGPDGIGRYLSDPLSIIRVWEGGLHIFGGFLFGLIALLVYVRLRKLPALIYLDGIALGLPLGQALARWANFINQELYGPPTTLPWGLRIDPQFRIGPYGDLAAFPEATRFHPLFLYESLWNAIGFGLLFWASRRYAERLRPGDLLLLYLIWYPVGRFFIEFLRTDSWFFPGTPVNVVHIATAIMAIGAAIVFIRRDRTGNVQPVASSDSVEDEQSAQAQESEAAESADPRQPSAS